MTVGDRIKARLEALGMSQSALARHVGITQATIAALISGKSRSSTHLHKIARTLITTPAYLSGETDDPDEDAPPPPPAPIVRHVMMAVALPSDLALEQMFEAFLEVAGDGLSRAELARELAQQLPIGLAALQAPLWTQKAATARPRVLASGDREPPR